MNRTTKIILAVAVALLMAGGVVTLLLLRSARQAAQRVTLTDPQQVAAVGQGIADYQLPPGYQPQFGMQFLGFSLAVFTRAEEQHIMLMQFPAAAGLSQVEMEQELRQASQRETGELLDMRVVGRREVVIKGQRVTLTLSQGTDSEGQPYRMLSGIFQGKGGPTLLWIGSPIAGWDQAEIDAFIASIR